VGGSFEGSGEGGGRMKTKTPETERSLGGRWLWKERGVFSGKREGP